MPCRVRLRDGSLDIIASLGTAAEPTWSALSLTKRYLAVGSWSVSFPATARNWELATTPDVGVVIERATPDGSAVLMSGHAEALGYTCSADDGGPGVITLSGGDDLALIANRLAFGDPTHNFQSQPANAKDMQSGVLETVLRHYLHMNAGAGAIPGRAIPILDLANDEARGGTVVFTAVYDPLMDVLRARQATGGPLGFDITQQGSRLVGAFYQPRDLSGLMRFSRAIGNLRSISLQSSDPTVTDALVAGPPGAGGVPQNVDTSSPEATSFWTHIESYVDQSQTTDGTELAQAGAEALANGAASGSLSVTALDTPSRRFGVDYGLGDKVSVEAIPGVWTSDIVSAIDLTADDQGNESVSATIGSAGTDTADDATITAQLAARVRALERQIGRLQAG